MDNVKKEKNKREVAKEKWPRTKCIEEKGQELCD